ncbi:MAG TPA: DNA-binding protein [Anaerolineae bacterium]|mgnify:CR=1 FL=1|nr:DNA-binding protein [Anaerolineae bacterium]HQJ11197.1 DNA-binding protein [Anaerolineae bacterium]
MLDEPLLTQETLVALRLALLQWGTVHFRPFPWRQTQDPYAILLAEILLHRTQVNQMAAGYEQLLAAYPDISTLAAADRKALHMLLFSLGLRWRIDLLLAMAQEITNRFDGRIPTEKAALLSLPGVSEYIASAVRCFAWDQPEALIDTNTVRIIGRLLGWPVKDSSRRNARFREALQTLVDPEAPRAFNYALLDLAHLLCHKRQPPLCGECPLASWCHYPSATGGIHECS